LNPSYFAIKSLFFYTFVSRPLQSPTIGSLDGLENAIVRNRINRSPLLKDGLTPHLHQEPWLCQELSIHIASAMERAINSYLVREWGTISLYQKK
jgi:hypothetical protein